MSSSKVEVLDGSGMTSILDTCDEEGALFESLRMRNGRLMCGASARRDDIFGVPNMDEAEAEAECACSGSGVWLPRGSSCRDNLHVEYVCVRGVRKVSAQDETASKRLGGNETNL